MDRNTENREKGLKYSNPIFEWALTPSSLKQLSTSLTQNIHFWLKNGLIQSIVKIALTP
jgi:hypothetical protein